jgi:hypothetical protein
VNVVGTIPDPLQRLTHSGSQVSPLELDESETQQRLQGENCNVTNTTATAKGAIGTDQVKHFLHMKFSFSFFHLLK